MSLHFLIHKRRRNYCVGTRLQFVSFSSLPPVFPFHFHINGRPRRSITDDSAPQWNIRKPLTIQSQSKRRHPIRLRIFEAQPFGIFIGVAPGRRRTWERELRESCGSEEDPGRLTAAS